MTIGNSLRKIYKILEKNKINSANLEAEFLLSTVLNKSREFLYAYPEKKMSFWQLFKLNRILKKRLRCFPLAYLAGHKEFYGLDFFVNKNVLVPRPETELIIEEVLEYKNNNFNYIIDVGTGSGCIIVTLAKLLGGEKRDLNFYGLDISKKALQVARLNSEKNNTASCTKFLYSNLLEKILNKNFEESVLITANLPYLTIEQIKNSSTIKKEPILAIDGGVEGLALYQKLLNQINKNINIFRKGLIVFMEIDETQGSKIKDLIKNIFPQANLEIKKDLNNLDRLVIVKINN